MFNNVKLFDSFQVSPKVWTREGFKVQKILSICCQDDPVESDPVKPRQFHYSQCPKMRKFLCEPVVTSRHPPPPPSCTVNIWDCSNDLPVRWEQSPRLQSVTLSFEMGHLEERKRWLHITSSTSSLIYVFRFKLFVRCPLPFTPNARLPIEISDL